MSINFPKRDRQTGFPLVVVLEDMVSKGLDFD
jgi:hypothetical protein